MRASERVLNSEEQGHDDYNRKDIWDIRHTAALQYFFLS